MTDGYRALRERAAWLDLSARGKIFAGGMDSARLLHAMSTNHIEGLAPGAGCYVFFLNAQGRIKGDAVVLRLADRFLLDTEPETRERLYRHLDKYIIAEDVTLEDVTAQMATIGVEGPDAAGALRALGAAVPEEDYAHTEWDKKTVQKVSWTGGPGYRIYLPVGEKTALVTALGQPATEHEANIVRLEHGRPRYGVDISDMALPQETGQMHAVHFEKGCYLGQEIVERIRSRGHVNRLLTSLKLEGSEPPAPGTRLGTGAHAGAEITSAEFSPATGKVVALAYVRRAQG
jgi:aminomethyltransferase